jgi:hypothetical protein
MRPLGHDHCGLVEALTGSSTTMTRLTKKKSIMRGSPVITHDPVTVIVVAVGLVIVTTR